MNRIFILLVVLLVTLSGFGQAGPAQSGLQPPTQPTIPVFGSGTTYYVENVSGSDANNGTSTITPWKTIAHVNAEMGTYTAGSQILFYSNDVWHEQLSITASGIGIGSYGPQRNCQLSSTLVATCLNMPIIDGADIVNGWVLVTGNTYEAAYTATAVKGFVDSLYVQEPALTLQSSLANVEANPGSIYSNGTYVYVNLLDGTSPINHVVEVTGSRYYGIDIDNGSTVLSNITINGIEVVRADVCGICVDPSFGAVDTGIVVENNVLFNIGDTNNNQAYGAIEFGASALAGSPASNQVIGNLIGEMDLTPANYNYNAAAVAMYSQNSTTIIGNKIAPIYGQALTVEDNIAASCYGNLVSNNEITNSEGGMLNIGCPASVFTNNQVHNSQGNGLEIGGCLQASTTDCNNNGILVGYNTFHDLTPAYTDNLYNGLDINYATNGTAVGNTIYDVAAADMSLEGYSLGQASTGWLIEGNTFDATHNVSTTGVCCSGVPMYVTNYSYFNTTLKGNTMLFNANTNYVIFNALSAADSTHYYTQPAFDQICPGCETIGANGQFQTLNVNIPPAISQSSEIGVPLQALGSVGKYNAGATSLPLTTGQNGVLSSAQGGTGTAGRISTIVACCTTITATTLTTNGGKTGLQFPPLAQNTTGVGHCFVVWEQQTAASTVTFGIQNSVAPTGEATETIMSNDSTTVSAFAYSANATGITPVAITGTLTTATAATAYYMKADFIVVNASVAPLVISILGETGNASDALLIEPGSYCAWL